MCEMQHTKASRKFSIAFRFFILFSMIFAYFFYFYIAESKKGDH